MTFGVGHGARAMAVTGVASALLQAGCSHPTKSPAHEGTASFKFLEPAAKSKGSPGGETTAPRVPSDTVIPAEPILPLANPVYPASAKPRSYPVTVGVRITVDADGRVTDIQPSMRAISVASEPTPEFESAVAEALAQWRFKPAEAQHLVPKTDIAGREFWQVTKAEKTTWAFDVAFTFSPDGRVLPVQTK